MDRALRWMLMRLEPEEAHRRALQVLNLTYSLAPSLVRRYSPPSSPVTVNGLHFGNRIGLAAGYDKNAVAPLALSAMGFGHIELGTVTVEPQVGNKGQRVQRLTEHRALVNRMGFPSEGVVVFKERLIQAKSLAPQAIIGVNLGKNRATPNEEAAKDYCRLVLELGEHADYLTVNLSSPNTTSLRELQRAAPLRALLTAIIAQRNALQNRAPVWVKLSPDLQDSELLATLEVLDECGADAVVLTNTTTSRPVPATLEGGLSGRPLGPRSLHALELAAAHTSLPLISVGGIDDAASYRRRLEAGASLVQVFTALVYEGPQVLLRLSSNKDNPAKR